jgi:transmembrane sensor
MTAEQPKVTSKLVARWDPPRMAKNFDRIQTRLQKSRQNKRVGLVVAATIATAFLVILSFGRWHAQTARTATATRTSLVASTVPATETRFVDGSTATALTTGAILELKAASESEIVVAAKSGRYRFDVVPNPGRQFIVHIEEVTVRVLGTQFVVEKLDGRVDVSVERGRVEVTWPLGRRELGVGQSGRFPQNPEVTATPLDSATSEMTDANQIPSKAVSLLNERSRFIELSRQGNYQAAFSMVTRLPNLLESSAEDLMMAADAARLSNHPGQAVPYLQRITREYARDSRAPLAAFTLGRIYMNQLRQPILAAQAFALVRRLAPAGALVEDALAREAEALDQAGQYVAAERLASEYLRQYPKGRSRDKLRQLGNNAKNE